MIGRAARGKEKRQELRTDNVAFNEYVGLTQERWDAYASSNLPLTVLLFGLIEKYAVLSSSTVNGYAPGVIYRYFFALFDSIIAVLVILPTH